MGQVIVYGLYNCFLFEKNLLFHCDTFQHIAWQTWHIFKWKYVGILNFPWHYFAIYSRKYLAYWGLKQLNKEVQKWKWHNFLFKVIHKHLHNCWSRYSIMNFRQIQYETSPVCSVMSEEIGKKK